MQLGYHAAGDYSCFFVAGKYAAVYFGDYGRIIGFIGQYSGFFETVNQRYVEISGYAFCYFSCYGVGICVKQHSFSVVCYGGYYGYCAVAYYVGQHPAVYFIDIAYISVIYSGYGTFVREYYAGICSAYSHGVYAYSLQLRHDILVYPSGIDHRYDFQCFGIGYPAAVYHLCLYA